jgi:hypothetical protein
MRYGLKTRSAFHMEDASDLRDSSYLLRLKDLTTENTDHKDK